MNLCQEQNIVDVSIADAGKVLLIEEECFYFSFLVFEYRGELTFRNIEDIWSKFGCHRMILQLIQKTEMNVPKPPKTDSEAAFIGEVENDNVLFRQMQPISEEKVAPHAKVQQKPP